MDLKNTPWPKLLVAAAIAIVPATLSYCKASKETDVAQREADAGYKALVEHVEHLEHMVRAHEQMFEMLNGKRTASAAGSASTEPFGEPILPIPSMASASAPAPLPPNNADALRQMTE